MSNLADLVPDIVRYFGVTIEQANAMVDAIQPSVVIASMEDQGDVPNLGRIPWATSVVTPASVSNPSTLGIENPSGSGVDVYLKWWVNMALSTSQSATWTTIDGAFVPSVLTVANKPADTRISADPTGALSHAKVKRGNATFGGVDLLLPADEWVRMPDLILAPRTAVAVNTVPVNTSLRGIFSWVERIALKTA